MKLIVMAIVALLLSVKMENLFSETKTSLTDSAFSLRSTHQESASYGGLLDPQMMFWGQTEFHVITANNIEANFLPVYVLPLGNNSSFFKTGQDEKEKLQINRAEISGRYGFDQDYLKLTLGRQILSFGDGLLISEKNWHPVRQSFDGANLQVKYRSYQGDIFLFGIEKEKDHYDNGLTKRIYGGYHQFFLSELIKICTMQIDLYSLRYDNPRENVGDGFTNSIIKSNIYGARALLQKANWYVKYNLVKQQNEVILWASGKDKFENELKDLKIGNKSDSFGLYLNYFSASKNYLPFFSEDHSTLGVIDLFQLRNIKGYAISSSYYGAWNSELNLSYFVFNKYIENQGAFRVNGNIYKTSGYHEDSNIGKEVDLTMNIKIPENIFLYAVGGIFIPGTYLKKNFGNKKIYQINLGTTIKF